MSTSAHSGSASSDPTHDAYPPDTIRAGKRKIRTRLDRHRAPPRRVVPLGRYLPKPNTGGAPSSAQLQLTQGNEDLDPTHVEDGRIIVVPQGNGFLPSKPAANAIRMSIEENFTKGWKNWTALRQDTNDGQPPTPYQLIFNSFLEKATWLPEQHEAVEHAFNFRCGKRYSGLMMEARNKNTQPKYMGPVAYEALKDYWRTPEFKAFCESNKKNRASGKGRCNHAGGCISAGTHHQRLVDTLKRPVSLVEVHCHMNVKDDGSYVNDQARIVQDAFYDGWAEYRETQASSEGTSADPAEEERAKLAIWEKAVGPRKSDRLPGSGSMGPKLFRSGIVPSQSHSTSESTGRSHAAPSSLVADLTQQFNQKLNEQAQHYAQQLEILKEQQRITEERRAEDARINREQMQQLMAQFAQQSRPSPSSSSGSHMASAVGGAYQNWQQPLPQQQFPQYSPPYQYQQQYHQQQPPMQATQQQYPQHQYTQQQPPMQAPQQQYTHLSSFHENIDLNQQVDNYFARDFLSDNYYPGPDPHPQHPPQ